MERATGSGKVSDSESGRAQPVFPSHSQIQSLREVMGRSLKVWTHHFLFRNKLGPILNMTYFQRIQFYTYVSTVYLYMSDSALILSLMTTKVHK